ncbi:MAG TPA: aspartate aminotransferase family protein [Methylomirabilota bacterium]|nr:aspartate aminotransferase family protein [Methylomirabilota bacterium]
MSGKLPVVRTSVPGPRSQQLVKTEQAFLAPGIQRISLLSGVVFDHGEGATLTDVDGNTFIDFFAGVTVASLGHSHPRYVAALEEQLRRVTVGSFTSEARVRLVQKIAALTPGNLNRIQLFSGGAEAVEAALRLAKAYTKKYEVVGFWGGFHGKTGGVLGLVGDNFKQGWGPLPGGTHLVPYADCYRCPLNLRYPGCGLACADFIRTSLKHTSGGAIAAFLIEPVQGTAGNIVPPPEFLPVMKEVAREHDALFIVDEMITGFGRTGNLFGCALSGVTPDIMTVGKGMGNGFPVTGVISSDEIMAAKPFSQPSASSSSYGGNPLAAAAALSTIETIEDEGVVDNARRVGAFMLERLRAMQEKYEFLGDVRGAGLLIGLDLVKDRQSKIGLRREVTELIFQEALKRGLLMMGYMPRVRLNPPLTISLELAETGLAILDEVFDFVADKVDYQA